MKNISLFITLLLSASFIFTSCHNHYEDDIEAPVVTVESPAANAVIQGAIDLRIHVTDESLHEMNVKITRDTDGAVVFEENPTVHDESDFRYEKTFTPEGLSGDTPLTLTVTVHDHNENHTTQVVKFTAKP